MRRLAPIALPLLAALAVCLPAPCAAQDGAELQPFVRLYETGTPVSGEGIGDSLPVRADWQRVPEGTTDHAFSGDAVIRNDRVALLLRRGAGRADLYSRVEHGWALRCAVTADPAIRAATLRISENGGPAVEAVLGEGLYSLTFRMTLGEPIVSVVPGEGVEALELGTAPACVVLPEFFADDLVYPAASLKDDSMPVPVDNQALAMVEEPRGILMCLWRRSGRRMSIRSHEGSDGRVIAGLRLNCDGGAQTWLACLEAPGIWHAGGSGGQDPGWATPFAAYWRSTHGTTETGWKSTALENVEPTAHREYPRYLYVSYPIDRTTDTPLTVYCPTDVLRNTLGCGPCQYVLDTEGAGPEQQVTPDSVADWVERQFERGRQQRRADQIEQRLEAAVDQVAWMHERLAEYEGLGARIQGFLPEDDGHEITAIARKLAQTRGMVSHGPLPPPTRARTLAEALVGLAQESDLPVVEPDWAELCAGFRRIGAAQDRALAEARLAVRRIRLRLDGISGREAEAIRALLGEFEDAQSDESAG